MTRDEIIELAREADTGFHPGEKGPLSESICGIDQIIRFAALVAAAEREVCAKVCEEIAADRWALYKGRAPYTGSEDGRACQQVQGESIGAEDCATAIRARPEIERVYEISGKKEKQG